MKKEVPDWLKKSAVVARDIEKTTAEMDTLNATGLKRKEKDVFSKIEAEAKEGISALNKWRDLRVDHLLEDVKSFIGGDELTPINIAFSPTLIESRHEYHLEPSEGKLVFVSVDYGYGLVRRDKPEDLAKAIKNLFAGRELKPQDIRFLEIVRDIQNIRFTEPDMNWGDSFSFKDITTVFSLKLNANGFYVSQNFRKSALTSSALGKPDSADQLRETVDGFISRVLSTPPPPRANVYESNR